MITTLNKLSPRFLTIGLVLELLVLILAWLESAGDTTRFFQGAARLSGRVSLLFFVFLMIYATLMPKFDRHTQTFQTKYLLFRDFAIVHVIHWCLLAVSVSMSHFELLPIRVLGGAVAYGLVVTMPYLMSRPALNVPLLTGMQSAYMFWVWLVFTMTYTARLSGGSLVHTGSPVAWWPLFSVLILLIFWRSVYLLKGTLKKVKA
jgi:hypothetical protein